MTAVSATRTSPRSDDVRFESRFFNSMSSAATYNRSHAHKHSSSRSSRPSTTPRAHPNAVSVGQSHPPLLTPRGKTPQATRDGKSTSPSYFGFVVGGDDFIPPDSNPGHHARQNWATPQVSLESPRHVPMESNPEFAAFRRQSEKGPFSLNPGFSNMPSRPNTSRTKSDLSMSHPHTPLSPGSKPPMEQAPSGDVQKRMSVEQKPILDIPRHNSPISMSPRHSLTDDKAPRLSLPFNDMHASSLHKVQSRSDTLPHSHQSEIPSMVNPKLVAELLDHPGDVLLLDLRVYQHYVTSRIRGSLNLCIPTTLLKRPAFTTQKLAETFSSEPDRQKFETWHKCRYIVAYDACSSQPKEAMIPFNVLKKFSTEGWKGTGYVVKGGYQAFAKMEPTWVDKGPNNSSKGAANPALSISPPAKDVLPVAGGCSMPSAKSAANPFFGNIRQNMDLLDGVGQMPVKKPSHMSETSENNLPIWLKRASKSSDEGKRVSKTFLSIEKSEQKRMQNALGGPVCYGPEGPPKDQVQVAGIEKGSKNRYNNIFPFDHTRVRLQGVPSGECDYVNASYVKAEYSNRKYIATQAPIPPLSPISGASSGSKRCE